MALTATLVYVGPNRITYLIDNPNGALGTSKTITADGSATPDLVTDCVKSTFGRAASARLRAVCRAGLDGLGTVAAKNFTKAQAQDLFCGNGSSLAGNAIMPRAIIRIAGAVGAAGGPIAEVNADVDGAKVPKLTITAASVEGQAYLHIELQASPNGK